MCQILGVARSSVYYKPRKKPSDSKFENAVIEEFQKSRKNYGTRKLKIVLARRGFAASRRRIGKVMKKYGLVSNYTIKTQPKGKKALVNHDPIENKVDRKFSSRKRFEVVVSDLTYVKVGGKWNYICLLLDLSNREIIGYAAGKNKDAKLVRSAFFTTKADLRKVGYFHTDRGSEFKNRLIEEILAAFGIKRSLSRPGTPIDNAVAESMYSIIKTEFAFRREWVDLDELELDLFDYVNWYNHVRIHGSLGYVTPFEARNQTA